VDINIIVEKYRYKNEFEKKLVVSFLNNLNKERIKKGTVSIEDDLKLKVITVRRLGITKKVILKTKSAR